MPDAPGLKKDGAPVATAEGREASPGWVGGKREKWGRAAETPESSGSLQRYSTPFWVSRSFFWRRMMPPSSSWAIFL